MDQTLDGGGRFKPGAGVGGFLDRQKHVLDAVVQEEARLGLEGHGREPPPFPLPGKSGEVDVGRDVLVSDLGIEISGSPVAEMAEGGPVGPDLGIKLFGPVAVIEGENEPPFQSPRDPLHPFAVRGLLSVLPSAPR